ncbi:MAG: cupredoxin domain-containing protein [Planctomycetia bacterium]|nr:cupredoxin domain-containing protein [Planctomycetia bacterium]
MWDFPLFPDRASTYAGWVDGVYFYALGLTVFFTALVCVLIVFFSVKYRRGSRADRSNPVTHNTALEEGRREINMLHVPVGRAVRLTMTSQDVIHSFYIPAFRVKQDVIPGRYTSLWFEATKPGTYHLFCAEYCGTLHSGMVGTVVVMEPVEFQRWLQSGAVKESLAVEGGRLFTRYGCNGCHGRNATVRAPLLEGVYGHAVPLSTGDVVTADERYIRDSILLPRSQIVAGYDPVMPTFEGHIGEGDLLKIISYIRSIGDTEKVEK